MESVSELVRMEADAILHSPFILEGHKDIIVKPLTIGQMFDITPELIALQEEDEGEKICNISNSNDFKESLLIINKYKNIISRIVGKIIGNNKVKKLTPDEMLIVFTAIVKRMQTKSFLDSIILTQRMSLSTKEGIIASQKYITG